MSRWHRISVEGLQQLKAEKNMLVLDMRDIGSYLTGRYPNALHLDSSHLRALLKHTAKQLPIVIYCQHGFASRKTAQLFADFGFTNCYSLDGGYEAWFASLEKRWLPTSSAA